MGTKKLKTKGDYKDALALCEKQLEASSWYKQLTFNLLGLLTILQK